MKNNNLFSRIFNSNKKMLDIPTAPDLLGWHESNKINTMHWLGDYDNQYENGYSSIRAIAKRFMTIDPYAIDANGKPVNQTAVINALGHPNQAMSMVEFREALAVMTLVHNKTYVRVWFNGDRRRESNITGFSILEGVQEISDGETTTYQTRFGTTLTEDQVMVFKDINPYSLEDGYSPANAARRWAKLDDYIAAYQAGFFENGAVPAGQFLIAATGTEFEDIVRNLKNAHKGASKNNNVIYSSTPVNPVDGKPMPAQVTWVPMNTSNKDLDMSSIFDQVNKKVDSAYAVPSSVRGVSEGSTYVNVRIDQELFIDNTVRPFALKVWDRFSHELNRITGGLGYTIVFDIETPYIAEEGKAKAEAQSVQTGSLITLLNQGFTLKSAATALGLPEEFYKLKEEEKPAPVAEPVVEDVEEVDEGDEVEDSPEIEESKSIDAIDINCKHCGRYLMKATGTTIVEDMPCPKCKAHNNFKIINPLGDDKTHTFTFKETEPKDWKQVANSKALSEEQKALITDKIEMVIRNQMERQISRVDIKSKKLSTVDAEDAALYAQEVMSIVMPLISTEGMKQYLMARIITGIDASELKGSFALTESQVKRYRKYLEGVAKGYAEDTEKNIKSVLESGIGENLPAQDIKKNLAGVMQTDEWRVKRLALTETNRAGNTGSISAMEQVEKEAKIKINKVWQAQNGACEYCVALSGKEVGVSDEFVAKDEEITGKDGGVMKNTFGHMDVPTAHPNCSCYVTYKVEK